MQRQEIEERRGIPISVFHVHRPKRTCTYRIASPSPAYKLPTRSLAAQYESERAKCWPGGWTRNRHAPSLGAKYLLERAHAKWSVCRLVSLLSQPPFGVGPGTVLVAAANGTKLGTCAVRRGTDSARVHTHGEITSTSTQRLPCRGYSHSIEFGKSPAICAQNH